MEVILLNNKKITDDIEKIISSVMNKIIHFKIYCSKLIDNISKKTLI